MSEDETLHAQPPFIGEILGEDSPKAAQKSHVDRLGEVQGSSDAWRVAHMVGREGKTEFNESIITLLVPSMLDFRKIESRSQGIGDWEHTESTPNIATLRDGMLIDLLEASIDRVPGLSVKVAFGRQRLVLDEENQWHTAVKSGDDGKMYFAPIEGSTLTINADPESKIKFRFHINPEKFPEADKLESSLNRVSNGLVSRADACGLKINSYHSSHISSAV